MSGDARMKTTPIPLTQAEVDALSGEGKAALGARRRIRATRNPKKRAPPSRKGDKAAPPRLTKKDLAAISSGRPGAALRKRLFKPSIQPAEASGYSKGQKEAPTVPPSTSSSR
jgi:hypothetical protein